MVKIKPANQDTQVTSTVNRRGFSLHKLLLFIVASLVVHGLGLILFALYQPPKLAKEKTESKPIDFVVVPEEPEAKSQPKAEKVEPKETTEESDTINPPVEKIAPPPQPATPEPEPAPPQPKAPPPVNNQPPVLSNSDSAATTPSKPAPPKPETPIASNESPKSELPEPEPPQTTAALPKQPENSASSLLGGDYEKNLANSGDAFFSEEALTFNAVLDPDQLALLKKFNLNKYFEEVLRQIKSNLNDTHSEILATGLSITILQNGQLDEIKVNKSSGSDDFDNQALSTVRKSAPFKPLPSEFPLDSLELEFVIYTDLDRR